MKKLLSIAAVLGVAGALAFGASSANADEAAPTLPAGQALYNIDCEDNAPQLWTFTTDGASTPVGAPGIAADCAGGAATNPVDGKSYFILYPGGPASDLASVDLVTGAVTDIAPISGAATGAWQLIITKTGDSYVSNGSDFYSINLGSGVTTLIGDMGRAPGGMAYNPVDDEIYLFINGNIMEIYTVDPATAALTDVSVEANWPQFTCLGTGGTDTGNPDGAAFDSNGIAWIQSDSCDSNVMAFDPVTGNAFAMGELFDSTGTIYSTAPSDYYSESFFIAAAPVPPAPVLAKTGIDYTTVGTIGAGAAALALAGLAMLITRRRSRASA